MINLLDVSVLIALIDTDHEGHKLAQEWFATARNEGWATCPLTENGVVRIVGSSTYPNSPGSLAQTLALVRILRQLPGHTFWPDDISLFDSSRMIAARLKTTTQITDIYLLALAVAHSAKLVTFDRRIDTAAVQGGAQALLILGA